MLCYQSFLLSAGDEELRQEMYVLFKKAMSHLEDLNPSVEIKSVALGGPCYYDTRHVEIRLRADDKGVLFHEVGHAILAQSVFHSCHNPINQARNETWGEAFSEAFRWLVEKECLGVSWWTRQFEDDKQQVGSDKYRAELILKQSGHTLDGFKALWKRLVAGFDCTEGYLDRMLRLH